MNKSSTAVFKAGLLHTVRRESEELRSLLVELLGVEHGTYVFSQLVAWAQGYEDVLQ